MTDNIPNHRQIGSILVEPYYSNTQRVEVLNCTFSRSLKHWQFSNLFVAYYIWLSYELPRLLEIIDYIENRHWECEGRGVWDILGKPPATQPTALLAAS